MFNCVACAMSRRRFLAAATGAAGTVAIAGPMRARAAEAGLVTDFHTHMCDPLLKGGWEGANRDAVLRPETHIARMEKLGIDRHVVGHSGGMQGISWGDARQDLVVMRRNNDTIAKNWVGRYPTRFIGAFGVPTQDLSLGLPEVERMAQTPGMRVLQVSSHTPDKIYYGDPSLDPLMAALERHNIILFIHPHLQNTAYPLDKFALGNSIGQGIEEAKVMTNIIYNGVFEKFPKLKILVSHGGGFLPHYTGRLDRLGRNSPSSLVNLKADPSTYVKRFYFDSCVYSSEVLGRLAQAVGSDRIVLGGDYPVGDPQPINEVRGAKSLSSADVTAILAGNATRLLS